MDESDESTSGSTGGSWVDSYSSCDSDTDPCCEERSPIPWEAEVEENGNLLYIESYPQVESPEHNVSQQNTQSKVKGGQLTSTANTSSPGKLIRLIRHRESKRRHKNSPISVGNGDTTNDTLPKQPIVVKENETYNIVLNVDPWLRQNLGRRASSTESILGLITTTGPDCEMVVITGLVPDGPAAVHGEICVGDCIVKINGQNVSANTINLVIRSITVAKEVQLTLERKPRNLGDFPDHSSDKEIAQSPLVQLLVGKSDKKYFLDTFAQWSVLVLFLKTDGLVEGGPEDQGVIYCFPRPMEKNVLGQVRGAFLTLQHLLPGVSGSGPKSSSVMVRGFLSHVLYTSENSNGLLLFCLPQKWCSLEEFSSFCEECVRALRFCYDKLFSCFSDKSLQESLDHFFTLSLMRFVKERPDSEVNVSLETSHVSSPTISLLEHMLPAAQWIPLPREAQVQIDDALSELESNDIGDFCEDHNCQRLYSILGSCVYHKGYLLATHMASQDIVDVHSLCRLSGILELTHNEAVRSLVVWREVYPSSCQEVSQEESVPYQLSGARWFLLMVGQKHNLLAVLLEAGGCSGGVDENPGPDSLYVEAVEDTLHHIERTGSFSVASKWLASNLRPQPTSPDAIATMSSFPRRMNNLLGLRLDSGASLLRQTGSSTRTGSGSSRTSHEMLLLNKRQTSPELSGQHASTGPHGETSEDSGSLAPSLPSDEYPPGRGRHDRYDASDDSDSDYEFYHDHSSGQRSRMDLSSLHKSLLHEVENVMPVKLTAGAENMLFHFVHLDVNEGILLSPPIKDHQQPPFSDIMENFRRSSLHIHTLLQNSISFKNLSGADISRTPINKSLAAIKEFGALFECRAQSKGNEKSPVVYTYWVVGRLFFAPHPREMYVCYHDGAPQNMVEIAFRLGLNSAG